MLILLTSSISQLIDSPQETPLQTCPASLQPSLKRESTTPAEHSSPTTTSPVPNVIVITEDVVFQASTTFINALPVHWRTPTIVNFLWLIITWLRLTGLCWCPATAANWLQYSSLLLQGCPWCYHTRVAYVDDKRTWRQRQRREHPAYHASCISHLGCGE